MRTGQIPVRLPRPVVERFRAYANDQHISESELVRLLFERERRIRRLEALCREGAAPIRPRAKPGKAVEMDVVTVYFTPEERVEFEAYVAACGIKKGDASGWLLEQELREAWLQRALEAA